MKTTLLAGLALAAVLTAAAGAVPAAEIAPRYEYTLADFTGPVPFMGVRVRLDAAREEAFILSGGYLRVFGPTGMETFSLPLDPEFGAVQDVAVDENGDLYFLAHEWIQSPGTTGFYLLRCDYRGVAREKLVPAGIPEKLADFLPNTLIYAGGRFYVSVSNRMQVLVLSKRAGLEQVKDFTESLPEEKEIRKNAIIMITPMKWQMNAIHMSVRIPSASQSGPRTKIESVKPQIAAPPIQPTCSLFNANRA